VSNFQGIKYFRPDSGDNWGDPAKISQDLLINLDYLRELAKAPIYVTSGYRVNSSMSDSQHKYGRAVDICCPALSLLDFYLLAERVGFGGIGVYPHWHYKGTTCGGIHVDVRPEAGARWMAVMVDAAKQNYIALNKKNLKAYGVI
jgi:uncharacterized protein YcbK (DUF882 family)